MKILVTGAGGFLGLHIAKLLIDEGHTVTNFSRSHNLELDSVGVKTIKGDLSIPKDIKKALIGIEAVFHVASKVGMWGKWEDYYNTNTLGTENLINLMKEQHIKYLVYTSTPSVVFSSKDLKGETEDLPYPKKFLNHYSRSKAMAEEIVKNANCEEFKTVSLRPHLIYGERDINLIPRLVEAKKSGRLKIVGSGQNEVDIIYVENAAKAHIQAFLELLNKDSKVQGKSYFLGQERPVKLWDFFNKVLEIYKEKPLTTKISLPIAYSIGALMEFFYSLLKVYNKEPPMTRFVALNLAKSHYFSHKNAQNDFNYKPEVSIDESLEKLNRYINS